MSDTPGRDADAVRYVVLRKLAPGLRHALMGELQGIQFLAELAARLLQTGADEARMRACIGKIPAATGAAIATGQSLIAWLRPDEGASTTLAEVVGQCVKLAGDDWRMRGIEAAIDIPAPAGERVSAAAARELVVASLLAMTDGSSEPLDVGITAALEGDAVELRFQARISSRQVLFPLAATGNRAVDWADVAVLASAHGVGCTREREHFALRFALAPPARVLPG